MAPIFMLLLISYQFWHPSSIWLITKTLKEVVELLLLLRYDNPWIFHSNWLVLHINFINAFNGAYFNNQGLLPLKDVKSMLVWFFHRDIKLDMKLYNLIFFSKHQSYIFHYFQHPHNSFEHQSPFNDFYIIFPQMPFLDWDPLITHMTL